MKHLIIFIVLALYSFFTVHSQVNKLNAVVLDEKNVPIPYATVYNSNTNRGIITNKEGRFELNAQPNDIIVIRCLGYQEYKEAAEQLKYAGVVILKETIFNISEVVINPNSIDAKSIVRKFHANIGRNYPRRATVIRGIYKEYSLIENEYYGFLQCNIDIFIKSIASFSPPNFSTNVSDYKLFRHPERKSIDVIRFEGRLTNFWIFGYSFLWNFKEYEYSYAGFTIYNDAKLIKIKFYPKQINKYANQAEGTMYIDQKTYALIFLQYEILPNERDFSFHYGRWQKGIAAVNKIMFEKIDRYYYPTYVINEQTSQGVVSDWEVKPNNKDTVTINFVFNFFTKQIKYNPKNFVADSISLYQLNNNNVLDQSKDYKNDFILETEQERQLFQ